MQFQEYRQYDAVGLAELIRTGAVSADEVLQALGNAYYLQNKPSAALEQYQLASQAPGDDFYVRSSIEARIRELQTQLDEARKENGGKPLPRERFQDQHIHTPLAAHRH